MSEHSHSKQETLRNEVAILTSILNTERITPELQSLVNGTLLKEIKEYFQPTKE